jgi:uncharacterized BrkB/YihY/UPF0761 family membrane protein
MKKAKNFLNVLIVSLLLVFSFSSGVHASNLWNQQDLLDGSVESAFGESKNSPTDIRYQIVNIINIILTLLGIITIILMIYAGFRWMTSAGNEDAISSAKNILKNAIIGLVIITFAWSITVFVLRRLDRKYLENDGYHQWE